MNRRLFHQALDRIGDATPMHFDCGRLCAAACCAPDEDGQGGVYLFPGEFAEDFDWGDTVRDSFGDMLVCREACDRDYRPFACRIFPLTPYLGKAGEWQVRMDARARPVCPMVKYGLRGLDPEFVRRVREALRLLASDPEYEAFLRRWQALEERYRIRIEDLAART